MNRISLALVIALVLLSSLAAADWGDAGLLVNPSPADPSNAVIHVGDRSPDTYVVYSILVEGGSHLYAQRYDDSGNPFWGDEGVLLSNLPLFNVNPVVATNDRGELFVAWHHSWDPQVLDEIWMQKVDGNGNLQWGEDGVYAPASTVIERKIVTCKDGGAWLAWTSWGYENGHSIAWQFAFKFSSNGTWALLEPVFLNRMDRFDWAGIKAVPDYEGGIVVIYGTGTDEQISIHANRIDPNGTLLWGDDGVRIVENIPDVEEKLQAVVSDKHGGAVFSWSGDTVYIQHLYANGQLAWSTPPTVELGGGPQSIDIAYDHTSGTVIALNRLQNGWLTEVFANKVNHQGQWLWGEEPVSLGDDECDRKNLKVVNNGNSGAIIAYSALRDGVPTAVHQQIRYDGTLLWPGGGMSVATDQNEALCLSMTSIPGGRAVLVWADDETEYDHRIHAQLLGPFPPISIPGRCAGEALEGNNPNPFNPSTEIVFHLERMESVRLTVLDVRGRLVRTLAEGSFGSGEHRVAWHGLDASGRPAPSGMYFYRLHHGNLVETGRMNLVK